MSSSRRVVLFVAVLCATASSVPCRGAEQYKKIARDAVSDLVGGKHDKTIRETEDYLRDHPDDLESLYVMAAAHAQKGQVKEALLYVRKAVARGLPFERFQAGPRELLAPLTESAEFKEMAERHGSTLLHGPMLGDVTDRRVSFWVRTAGEVPVRVNLFEPDETGRPIRTAEGRSRRETDFTAVLQVDGLEPDTHYDYVVQTGEEAAMWKGRVRTFPAQGRPARFTIGFGGGAGFTPQHERMWNVTRSRDLTAFLFLGDNVYIDNPTRRAVQQYCYYRRQSRPEYRRFVATTPIFAIWDDHDFTTDDGWGGPEINVPEWKVPVWHTFRHNWVNPYYGGGEPQPGCWFHFSIADVDFFMLDGRYYRVKGRRQGVEVENPSMLGAAQKKWLFERLKESKGTFKVIASPVPWSFGAKPGRAGMDTWEGFREEREAIFSFLERNKIDGVILISADRHRSDAWKNERDNGYPLYEFESSRLTNIHTHPVMPGSLFGYNDKCSFGQITFDTTASDPTVAYRVVNIDNETIHTLVLKQSQLTHRR